MHYASEVVAPARMLLTKCSGFSQFNFRPCDPFLIRFLGPPDLFADSISTATAAAVAAGLLICGLVYPRFVHSESRRLCIRRASRTTGFRNADASLDRIFFNT